MSITRRNLIKSMAILGAGATTVPLITNASETGDGIALFSTRHPQRGNRFVTPGDLSEAALEDMLIEVERNSNRLTSTQDWWINPHLNDANFVWFERV